MIRRAALVTTFAAVLVLLPLGQRYIVTGDEARFAVLAQDMLARATWVDARVRDQRYRNKPLLYPWAIKLLSMPRGRVTEATAQLPIAIGAIAAVFFTTLLGQQLFGPAAGVFAGLITTTSYSFFSHSQILLPDMLVAACGVAALSAFWSAVTHPPGARARVGFYAAIALGVAAKGPMGLLPLLVVVVWLLTEDGIRGLRRLGSVVGLVTFAVVTAAWLVPFLFAGSRTFARAVVWEDWLAWYLGGPQPSKMLNMLLDFAKGLIPWTTVFVLPLLAVRAAWRDSAYRFTFLAWLIPLIVVLLSQNHRARYLLPTYPTAALLVAWWITRRGAEPSRAVPWVTALTAVGGLAALVVIALPWLDTEERALVSHFWWKAGVIAVTWLGLVVYACWAVLRKPRALVPGLAAGMAVLLLSGLMIHNGWVNRGQDYPALAALIERHAHGGDVGVSGGRFFSIDFYLRRALTPVRTAQTFDAWTARPDRPVVVVTDRAWGLLRDHVGPDHEIVDSMRIRAHTMLIIRRAAAR